MSDSSSGMEEENESLSDDWTMIDHDDSERNQENNQSDNDQDEDGVSPPAKEEEEEEEEVEVTEEEEEEDAPTKGQSLEEVKVPSGTESSDIETLEHPEPEELMEYCNSPEEVLGRGDLFRFMPSQNRFPEYYAGDADTESLSSEGSPEEKVRRRRTEKPEATQDEETDLSLASQPSLPENLAEIKPDPQYTHTPQEAINNRLNTILMVVVFLVVGLGIGHFLGWSRRSLFDESLNAKQVRQLRQLQDNLLSCMSASSPATDDPSRCSANSERLNLNVEPSFESDIISTRNYVPSSDFAPSPGYPPNYDHIIETFVERLEESGVILNAVPFYEQQYESHSKVDDEDEIEIERIFHEDSSMKVDDPSISTSIISELNSSNIEIENVSDALNDRQEENLIPNSKIENIYIEETEIKVNTHNIIENLLFENIVFDHDKLNIQTGDDIDAIIETNDVIDVDIKQENVIDVGIKPKDIDVNIRPEDVIDVGIKPEDIIDVSTKPEDVIDVNTKPEDVTNVKTKPEDVIDVNIKSDDIIDFGIEKDSTIDVSIGSDDINSNVKMDQSNRSPVIESVLDDNRQEDRVIREKNIDVEKFNEKLIMQLKDAYIRFLSIEGEPYYLTKERLKFLDDESEAKAVYKSWFRLFSKIDKEEAVMLEKNLRPLRKSYIEEDHTQPLHKLPTTEEDHIITETKTTPEVPDKYMDLFFQNLKFLDTVKMGNLQKIESKYKSELGTEVNYSHIIEEEDYNRRQKDASTAEQIIVQSKSEKLSDFEDTRKFDNEDEILSSKEILKKLEKHINYFQSDYDEINWDTVQKPDKFVIFPEILNKYGNELTKEKTLKIKKSETLTHSKYNQRVQNFEKELVDDEDTDYIYQKEDYRIPPKKRIYKNQYEDVEKCAHFDQESCVVDVKEEDEEADYIYQSENSLFPSKEENYKVKNKFVNKGERKTKRTFKFCSNDCHLYRTPGFDPSCCPDFIETNHFPQILEHLDSENEDLQVKISELQAENKEPFKITGKEGKEARYLREKISRLISENEDMRLALSKHQYSGLPDADKGEFNKISQENYYLRTSFLKLTHLVPDNDKLESSLQYLEDHHKDLLRKVGQIRHEQPHPKELTPMVKQLEEMRSVVAQEAKKRNPPSSIANARSYLTYMGQIFSQFTYLHDWDEKSTSEKIDLAKDFFQYWLPKGVKVSAKMQDEIVRSRSQFNSIKTSLHKKWKQLKDLTNPDTIVNVGQSTVTKMNRVIVNVVNKMKEIGQTTIMNTNKQLEHSIFALSAGLAKLNKQFDETWKSLEIRIAMSEKYDNYVEDDDNDDDEINDENDDNDDDEDDEDDDTDNDNEGDVIDDYIKSSTSDKDESVKETVEEKKPSPVTPNTDKKADVEAKPPIETKMIKEEVQKQIMDKEIEKIRGKDEHKREDYRDKRRIGKDKKVEIKKEEKPKSVMHERKYEKETPKEKRREFHKEEKYVKEDKKDVKEDKKEERKTLADRIKEKQEEEEKHLKEEARYFKGQYNKFDKVKEESNKVSSSDYARKHQRRKDDVDDDDDDDDEDDSDDVQKSASGLKRHWEKPQKKNYFREQSGPKKQFIRRRGKEDDMPAGRDKREKKGKDVDKRGKDADKRYKGGKDADKRDKKGKEWDKRDKRDSKRVDMKKKEWNKDDKRTKGNKEYKNNKENRWNDKNKETRGKFLARENKNKNKIGFDFKKGKYPNREKLQPPKSKEVKFLKVSDDMRP